MNFTVFGASGPTGLQVVRQALAAGHAVTAVTRHPDDYPLHAPQLAVAAADVGDPEGVSRAVSGSEAIISTFGVPYSRRPITVYSHGITNIAQAMTGQGIRRLVCVSSTTVSSKEAPGETLFWRKAVVPFLRNVLGRTLYDDMERMEAIVRGSGLDWTIMRPAGLFNTTTPTDDYELSTRHLRGRFTSRADLAKALLDEATAPQYPQSTIEVITRSGHPSSIAFVKEALGFRG